MAFDNTMTVQELIFDRILQTYKLTESEQTVTK
jgi:hypothetical protein